MGLKTEVDHGTTYKLRPPGSEMEQLHTHSYYYNSKN